jgi:hypothetical protein
VDLPITEIGLARSVELLSKSHLRGPGTQTEPLSRTITVDRSVSQEGSYIAESEPEVETQQRREPFPIRKFIMRLRPLLVILLLGFYCAMLARSFSEGERRSLELRDDTDSGDHVEVSARTDVNPAKQEVTAQITLKPQSALALDDVTPARDLKLLTNNVRSQ